jgi:hypothetical protein
MQDFLTTQPQIKHKNEDVPQPQLRFYEIGAEKPAETLFPTYVPVGMVKDIMREKGLLHNNDDL